MWSPTHVEVLGKKTDKLNFEIDKQIDFIGILELEHLPTQQYKHYNSKISF